MPLSAAQEYPILEFGQWLQSPSGRYLAEWEQAQLDAAVSDVFGFYALQVGLPEIDGLRANRIAFKAGVHERNAPGKFAGGRRQAQVVASFDELPFDSQSVDLLVLPHTLDCAPDPHAVLREAARVLMPEGRLVVTGFNPWSLWAMRRSVGRRGGFLPVSVDPLSVARLKDWLKLLSFEADRASFGAYVPPCESEAWLRRFAFMEGAGARWWPFCGAAYVVSAVKRNTGMRVIGPGWKAQRVARRGAVAVAPRLVAKDDAASLPGER